MTTILTKRAYDPAFPQDGLRVLVDRLWPRGLSKDKAALDHWMKDLAPTTALREWFNHRPERFAEFKRRYHEELRHNPAVPDALAQMKGRTVTLVYGARDPAINHAVVLAEFLETSRHKTSGS
jgi:uncharacterized protein YeaO (DUF488 family)